MSDDTVPDTDPEPRLPYRCGTMLLSSTPEERAEITKWWREREADWLAWYARQPARRLTDGHHRTRQRLQATRAFTAALDARPDVTEALGALKPGETLVVNGLPDLFPERRPTPANESAATGAADGAESRRVCLFERLTGARREKMPCGNRQKRPERD